MNPKTHTKSILNKSMRVCKRASATQAIGVIGKNTDTFILTYGQFSLVDALLAILDQTGPAHVSISTWTAAHAHLGRTAALMESASILSYRMIVDRSFRTRQPKYFESMIGLFGPECIREITTHAKFMLVRNNDWDIVVRTSMNLNENPRLENIEISENKDFAIFFEDLICDVFNEVPAGFAMSDLPKLNATPETDQFKLVSGEFINTQTLKEASYTHEIQKS